VARKGGYRSHLDVDTLAGKPLASNRQCAGLVEYYTRVGKHTGWTAGDTVKGNKTIRKGTAIATFVKGEYQNNLHGNHAALYISQDDTGIWVMDQWDGDPNKPAISSRHIEFKNLPQNADGSWPDASNNGDAFSIIELKDPP
jgi:hypothetical protein